MNNPTKFSTQGPVSRRGFIKTSSTAVAGGVLATSFFVGKSKAENAGADLLKVALIGCGGRGAGAANQALSTQGNVKLVAMADAFRDRLDGAYNELSKAFQNQPGRVEVPEEAKFVGFDAYKQAIALADVVILATPPGFRPAQFEEAVRQGKHVFMEKPVAVDAPGVRRVLAAAEEAKKKNLKIGVGLQRHHSDAYNETIKRLQDGAIGDIVSMRCYWNGNELWVKNRQPNQTEMEYQMRNWYYFNWLSGDHIVEQHIHNIDVINWVKGKYPIRAQGMGGRQVRTGIDHGEIFDHHFVEFEYDDGSRLYSQCRQQGGTWNSVSEHVQGTKGSSDISSFVIRGDNPWKFKGENPNPYQKEHDDLFAAIRSNTPFSEAEFGALSSMAAILGRLATYSGKMIEWNAALNSNIDLSPKALAWDAAPPVIPGTDGRYVIAVPGKTSVV